MSAAPNPAVGTSAPTVAAAAASSAIDLNRLLIVSDFLDRISQNPIWDLRIEPQGQASAALDVNRHLDNLQIAVQFNLVDSPAHYYHYLQNVSVWRGICTRHIRELLATLKLSILEIIPEYWAFIEPYLNSGYNGLEYKNPASGALNICENSLAVAVVERLSAGSKVEGSDYVGRAARFRDVLILISYLADSVEKQSIEIFDFYLEWLSATMEERAQTQRLLDQEIKLLSKEITRQLAPEHARRLRGIIRQVTRAG